MSRETGIAPDGGTWFSGFVLVFVALIGESLSVGVVFRDGNEVIRGSVRQLPDSGSDGAKTTSGRSTARLHRI
jgi:hypothetical protein